jgi:hypothetical protein
MSVYKRLFFIEVESSCYNSSVTIIINTDRLVIFAIVLGRYFMGIVGFRRVLRAYLLLNNSGDPIFVNFLSHGYDSVYLIYINFKARAKIYYSIVV